MSAARLKNTGRYRVRPPAQPDEIEADNLKTVMKTMDRDANVATPLRPSGADTSSTDCNASPGGTVVRMTGLDRILNIDPLNYTVTAQGGVRKRWPRKGSNSRAATR